MIITKLQGGLGNQMFQYALAKVIALKYHTSAKVDLSFLISDSKGVYTQRNYELNGFDTKIEIASGEEVRPFLDLQRSSWKNLLNSVRAKNKRLVYYREKGLYFDKAVFDIGSSVYLDGFWQNEKYFSDYRKEILDTFKFKTEDIAIASKYLDKFTGTGQSVSIHIRRGDYVSLKSASEFHGICSMEYYTEAVKIIKDKIGSISLFVFSDDQKWCRDNLNFDVPVNFVGLDNPFSEMYLMSQCQHNIIANSSFSWWGAWLNTNPGKLVVGPKHWFKDPIHNPKEILPVSWTKL